MKNNIQIITLFTLMLFSQSLLAAETEEERSALDIFMYSNNYWGYLFIYT